VAKTAGQAVLSPLARASPSTARHHAKCRVIRGAGRKRNWRFSTMSKDYGQTR
jgi:hypothetical protein